MPTPKNYMESLVLDALKEIKKSETYEDFCDKCIKDILSISLNNLPPMYYSCNEPYVKLKSLDLQTKASITTEVLKAMEIVKENPQHTPQNS